ncbi:hypothetical protein Q5H93_05750 [Hymenobacter sp. ASUV-10]|uniref:Uncharacterized protein n=1 Tax=Hymenobacter aranciens TaxID=3063996 RepID=A0ABT9B7I1_9BACT|nr:hypothetical protein [Hymenobacter sp. ASUV-10]MDO7874229.1 hypothetical protein [Hymenobacter sp. ASUV-10]
MSLTVNFIPSFANGGHFIITTEGTEKLGNWLLFVGLDKDIPGNKGYDGGPVRHDLSPITLHDGDKVEVHGGDGPTLDYAVQGSTRRLYWNKEPNPWEWLPSGYALIGLLWEEGRDYSELMSTFYSAREAHRAKTVE